MADRICKERRSQNMAAIRGKDTEPELYLRKLLFSHGYRYRINVKSVPGHPDLYLAKYNATVFVNGCFWHRHKNCKLAYVPKSRVEFWERKFSANVNRDGTVRELLQQNGIRQLVIWECTIRKMKHSDDEKEEILKQVEEFLHSDERFREI